MVRQSEHQAHKVPQQEPPGDPWAREDVLSRLRPAENTPQAVQAAAVLAESMVDGLSRQVDADRQAWLDRQMFGDSAAIADAQAAMRAHEDTLAVICGFRDTLRKRAEILLEEARQAATQVHADAANAAIQEANRVGEDFALAWKLDYAAAAGAIARLLDQEEAAHALHKRAQNLQMHALRNGATEKQFARLEHPTRLALGGMLNFSSQRLGAVVQLPGVLGAPFIPAHFGTKIVDEEEQFRDPEAPRAEWVHDGSGMYADNLKPPLCTRTVRRHVPHHEIDREDAPFWVHLGTPLDGKEPLYRRLGTDNK